MGDFGSEANGDDPIALRTPLYPILAALGVLIIIATFLPWASIESPTNSSLSESVAGVEAGGWGLSALVIGAVITALGVLGYVWNPFSDPEAAFIALFGALAAVGAIAKIADSSSLFTDESELAEFLAASPSIGLWLILLAGLASLAGGLWILFSRPRAQERLLAG